MHCTTSNRDKMYIHFLYLYIPCISERTEINKSQLQDLTRIIRYVGLILSAKNIEMHMEVSPI